MIIKRGFEYIIQDAKPNETDVGIEKLETNTNGFPYGDYYLDIPELYHLETDKEKWEFSPIWWYRAVMYVGEDLVRKVGEWKRNVPLVTTGTIDKYIAFGSVVWLEMNGTVTDQGGSEVQKVGARIYYDFSGKLIDLGYYNNPSSGWNIEGELIEHVITDKQSTITDIYWTGTFYKDVFQDYQLDNFKQAIGGGTYGEGLFGELLPDTEYRVMALAKNKAGTSCGQEVAIRTLPAMDWFIDESVTHLGDYLYKLTVSWGDTPFPIKRVGIKKGRTKSCNEIHLFQDGSFSNGGSLEFVVELLPDSTYYDMPYVVWNVLGEEVIKYGEEDWLESSYVFPSKWIILTPPLKQEDSETDPYRKKTIHGQGGSPSYSYREIIKEIYCENESDQSLIDYYGRRRSCKVVNHLIQNHNDCKLIVTDYLRKYETLKLKVAVSTDVLIPFEQEDYIVLGSAKYPYQKTGEGKIPFNTGIRPQPFILAKVRKTDISYQSEEAILNLELEV